MWVWISGTALTLVIKIDVRLLTVASSVVLWSLMFFGGIHGVEAQAFEMRYSNGETVALEVKGNVHLSRQELAQTFTAEDEQNGAQVWERIQERLIHQYRQLGFLNAQVVMIQRQRGAVSPSVSIEIHEGKRVSVVRFLFPGAEAFSESMLKEECQALFRARLPGGAFFEQVSSVELNHLVAPRDARTKPDHEQRHPENVYDPQVVAEAEEHLLQLYRSKGYLKAKVGPHRILRTDSEHLVLVIPIEENKQTQLLDVVVSGHQHMDEDEIQSLISLFKDEPFGFEILEVAKRNLKMRYQERGYFFARVDSRLVFSRDEGSVVVYLDVEEGVQPKIGSITIEGNKQTDMGVLRSRLAFRSGDALVTSALKESEDALLALGVFASVQIEVLDPQQVATFKNVLVTLKERNTQMVDASLGFSSGEGIRAGVQYTLRNIFGFATQLNLQARGAYQFLFQDAELENAITSLQFQDRLERRVSAELLFLHLPWSTQSKISVSLAHVRDNERDFGYDKNAATVAYTWQPTRRVLGSLSLDLEQSNVNLFDAGTLEDFLETADLRTQQLLRVPEGETLLGSARLNINIDGSDKPFRPEEGVVVTGQAEFAQTLSNERENEFSRFLKFNLSLTSYLNLYKHWILAIQLRYGRIVHLNTRDSASVTYPNRAYYLGGVDSMRGFLQDQVLPQDRADESLRTGIPAGAVIRGGDTMALLRMELRFPIVSDLHGGIFSDIGNVWSDAENVGVGSDIRLRANTGLGIRVQTPVGPIALDYGFNLTRNEILGEPFGALHFSVGVF